MIILKVFWRGWSSKNYLDIKVSVKQFGGFQTHQIENTMTSETQLWLHVLTYKQAERYPYTRKVSFSPSSFLQNLFCRNGSRHRSFECVWIFSPNTRQFLQRTKPNRRSHAQRSCIVSKALLCSYTLSFNLRSSPKTDATLLCTLYHTTASKHPKI